MDELPINADTVNKTLDIASESTKETRKELDKTGAKGIHKLAELLWASPIGRKADLYIAERPYKMKKALEEMQKKYDETIPSEYQVEPSSYIALKCVNELNYCLDEEHLKEMFENILISDMDSRKQNRVLPAYIYIINQLSKEDAEFLKLLKTSSTYDSGLYLISLQIENNDGFNWGNKYLITHTYIKDSDFYIQNAIKVSEYVLDNLLRLRIIEIPDDEHFTYKALYEQLFEYAKKVENLHSNNIKYKSQVLRVTPLGKNFIDICLS